MAKSTDNMERISQRRDKRRKRKQFGWISKAGIALVLIYLLVMILFSFRSSMTTSLALKGTVEESLMAEGYIFREQTVLNAPSDGNLECTVSEGERVNEGQNVAYVYTGQLDPNVSDEIRELNRQIERIMDNSENGGVYANNTVMVEQKISVAARNLSDLRQKYDMSITAARKDEINTLIDKKRSMEGLRASDADVLAQLQRRLQELEGSAGVKSAVTAPQGGVFSSRIDGFEQSLSPEALDNVTPAYLEELDQKTFQHQGAVTAGQPLCKIVNNYTWYYVVSLTEKEAESLKTGQKVKLKFYDLTNAAVDGTIRTISQPEKGKVAVCIYSNRYVEGIYSVSAAAAEIVTASSEGIKLPAKSLHVVDGQTGVYVIRLDVARFVPVNVFYKNDTWAIVGTVMDSGREYHLQIYDEVIAEGSRLEDGKVVR